MMQALPAPAPAPQAERRGQERDAAALSKSADNEYAATGMGRATDHRVVRVALDLEETPAHRIDVRYEFRPQLVRLGILPAAPDRLRDRDRGSGFEPGFSPVPPSLR